MLSEQEVGHDRIQGQLDILLHWLALQHMLEELRASLTSWPEELFVLTND